MTTFNIIVATDIMKGIGKNNGLPWRLTKDMNFFKKKTINSLHPYKLNAVIMGRNTWDSLPTKNKPLKERENIILSSKNIELTSTWRKDTNIFKNLDLALKYCEHKTFFEKYDKTFVIGGGQLYKEAIKYNNIKFIYQTEINKNYNCDVFFPEIQDKKFYLLKSTEVNDIDKNTNENVKLTFNTYINRDYFINKYENEYLKLVNEIIKNGNIKKDRTGVGTRSLFGKSLRFNIEDSFPLLTTKRVYWKGVVEELLWMLKGETNAKLLQDKNVHIWDGNSTREFLDSRNLNYEEGELGPVYGFQWRNFNGEYPKNKNKTGIDQIENIINLIKTDPNSRRILFSAWNPNQLNCMALPPCHLLAQFYVNNNELSCQMYQRSADIGLGVPFNIASYSLLTYIIANLTNLKPKEFILNIGDAHIYENHIDALMIQTERKARPFPKLKIINNKKTIDEFEFEDFKLIDYNPCSKIKMDMAI